MSGLKKLWILFRTTFLISLTANTGYAILSVMKSTFVQKYKWVSPEDMADYIAMAQSVPGPIAVNASVIIGYQTAGFSGALAAVSGCALPPLLVMIIVILFYNRLIENRMVAVFLKGMQYGVAAMLLDVLISLFTNVTKKDKEYAIVMIIVSFLYVRFVKYSIFFLALGCVAAGIIKVLLVNRKKEAE